jgi:hypothetical protein
MGSLAQTCLLAISSFSLCLLSLPLRLLGLLLLSFLQCFLLPLCLGYSSSLVCHFVNLLSHRLAFLVHSE